MALKANIVGGHLLDHVISSLAKDDYLLSKHDYLKATEARLTVVT